MIILLIWATALALIVLGNYFFHTTFKEVKFQEENKTATEIKILRSVTPKVKPKNINAWYNYIHAEVRKY